jgi:hypothetical protein
VLTKANAYDGSMNDLPNLAGALLAPPDTERLESHVPFENDSE